MNKILTFFSANKQLYIARYARPHELKNLVSPILYSSSLLLGKTLFNHFLNVTSTKNRRELGNLLVVAPTRGGKGLLAVSQLLTWKHSVIINDIKGDLFTQTAGYRSTLGEVIVIDPKGYGNRFDPLDGKTTEDELHSAATYLLFHPNEGEGAIFTQRAITMLTQIFLAAIAEGQPPFLYARKLIRMGLHGSAERLNTINPKLAIQFLDVSFENANFTDRFLLSAWGTLTARLRPLLTETIIRSLAGSDFSPSELMLSEKPITIYLKWTEQDLLALSPLIRLMWGSLIGELITSFDKAQGKNCNPVLLLIDEAGRTGIPHLSDIPIDEWTQERTDTEVVVVSHLVEHFHETMNKFVLCTSHDEFAESLNIPFPESAEIPKSLIKLESDGVIYNVYLREKSAWKIGLKDAFINRMQFC